MDFNKRVYQAAAREVEELVSHVVEQSLDFPSLLRLAPHGIAAEAQVNEQVRVRITVQWAF